MSRTPSEHRRSHDRPQGSAGSEERNEAARGESAQSRTPSEHRRGHERPQGSAGSEERNEAARGESAQSTPEPESLGAEATRLVEAVQGWARQALGEHTGPECRYCPLCRFLSALTAERPDLAVRVGEVTNTVVAAVRGLLEPQSPENRSAAEADQTDRPDDPAGADRNPSSPRTGRDVQRIDVTTD